jgi:hypothetical protein
MEAVRKKAVEDSADFILDNVQGAVLFDARENLWDYAMSKVKIPGMHLEFGVYNGHSINYFADRKPNQIIIGFDSFEGLAEDWSGTELVQGAFDLGGQLPVVSSNVRLVAGWFSETLPDFIQTSKDDIAFMHLDVDTYQAATYVLSLLGSRLVNGSILVLDEHHGYPNWRNGEFMALREFAKTRNVTYRYLGFSEQAALVELVAE